MVKKIAVLIVAHSCKLNGQHCKYTRSRVAGRVGDPCPGQRDVIVFADVYDKFRVKELMSRGEDWFEQQYER